MKKLLATIISICFVLVGGAGAAVFAADKYPENGSFTKHVVLDGLTDYAVGGGSFAFAHGSSVTVVGGDERLDYSHTSGVSALDFADGAFYFKDSAGASYTLPDFERCDYAFPDSDRLESERSAGGYKYLLIIEGGKLSYRAEGTAEYVEIGANYSKLKVYGDEAYALKEGVLYTFDGGTESAISGEDGSLTYKDYSETEDIVVPETILTDMRSPHLNFVTLHKGAYYSEVDLTRVATDKKFSVKKESTVPAKGGEVALLICKTGDSAIISMKGKSYILLSDNSDPETLSVETEPESTRASVLEPSVYSTPFANAGTQIASPALGKTVTLVKKISYRNVLQGDYYEVSYNNEEGVEVKGYMPAGFLLVGGAYADDENPTVTPTPKGDYSEATAVRTVLLIVIIVALLLVALGYVIFTATSDKRRKKKSGTVSGDEADSSSTH